MTQDLCLFSDSHVNYYASLAEVTGREKLLEKHKIQKKSLAIFTCSGKMILNTASQKHRSAKAGKYLQRLSSSTLLLRTGSATAGCSGPRPVEF